jgi:peptidoglycan hydrolase CwlO-like protein
MRERYSLIMVFALALVVCSSAVLFSQDMDQQEGIYRQQYEEYTARQDDLQEQIDGLNGVLTQIQALIDQINALPAETYAQQADRYEELTLLLPSAQRFSQEISQRQKRLDEVMRKIEGLKSTILSRQSSLPIWWRE